MSSSFVRDCSNSSSSNSGNNTVIIIVQNNDQNVTLDGDLQDMIASSDVSVLQMNNGLPVNNAVPQIEDGTIDASLLLNESFSSNFATDGLAPDISVPGVSSGQCADFPLDEDGIRKIESAINSQEAKEIFGESLVDFVNSPSAVINDLPPSSPERAPANNITQKSPKRRSQRQMDKAEKEEVEKILAENKKMMEQEKEMMRKAEEEKQKHEEMEVVEETEDEDDEEDDDDDEEEEEEEEEEEIVVTPKNSPKKILKISPSFTNKAKRMSHPGKRAENQAEITSTTTKRKKSVVNRKVLTHEVEVKLTKLPAKTVKKTGPKLSVARKVKAAVNKGRPGPLSKKGKPGPLVKKPKPAPPTKKVKPSPLSKKAKPESPSKNVVSDSSSKVKPESPSKNVITNTPKKVQLNKEKSTGTIESTDKLDRELASQSDHISSMKGINVKPCPLSKKVNFPGVSKKIKDPAPPAQIEGSMDSTNTERVESPSKKEKPSPLSKKGKPSLLAKKGKPSLPAKKGKPSPFFKKLESGSLFKKTKLAALVKEEKNKLLLKKKRVLHDEKKGDTPLLMKKTMASSLAIKEKLAKKENSAPDSISFPTHNENTGESGAEKHKERPEISPLKQNKKVIQSPNSIGSAGQNPSINSQSTDKLSKRKLNDESSPFPRKKSKASIGSDGGSPSSKSFETGSAVGNITPKKTNAQKGPPISSALSKFKIPLKKLPPDQRKTVPTSPGVPPVRQPLNNVENSDASNLVAKNVSQSDVVSALEGPKEKRSHTHTISPHLFQKQIKKRPSFEALLSMSDHAVAFKAKSSVAPKMNRVSKNSDVGQQSAQVRKSKRAIKKKVLDDEFVCPDESIAYSDEETSEEEVEEQEVENESPATQSDSDGFDAYDDPGKLWCKCQKPHNHRFMICCDGCQNWFHGSCVGVTKAMGKIMEQNNEEWMCSDCQEDIASGKTPKKKQEKKKPKRISPAKIKTKLKKWDETPENLTRDPHEARVLVYNKKTLVVRSGTQAPTLADFETWLQNHPNYAPVLPAMTELIITDPETGAKRLDLPPPKPDIVNLVSSPDSSKEQKSHGSPLMTSKRFYGSKTKKDIEMYQPSKKIKLVDPEEMEKERKKRKLDKLDITKARKQSSEKIKSPATPKPVTPTEKVSDKASIRDAVKKLLFEALDKRLQDVKSEFPDITSSKVQSLCTTIEDEIYRFFSKDVGFKYKSRTRGLVFNIKDAKNEGLFRKILTGDIKPRNLAKMTSEELASKELAAWRQQAEKKELEAIQKFELERLALGNKFIMKSHKGEIAIDKEDFSTSKIIEPAVLKLPEETEVIENDSSAKSTKRRKCSHDYDPSCDSCLKWSLETNTEILNKMNTAIKKKKEKTHKSSRHKSHKSRHSSSSSDKKRRSHDDRHSSSRHSSKRRHSSSKRRERSTSRERNKDKNEKVTPADTVSILDEILPLNETKTPDVNHGPPERTTTPPLPPPLTEDDYRTVNIPDSPCTPPLPATPDHEDSPITEIPYRNQSPQLPESPRTPDIDKALLSPSTPPPEGLKKSSVLVPVWRGHIHMPDVTKFHTACFEVSGDTESLGTDIPSSVEIVGRINPDLVWTYISQVRKSGTKNIVVVRFQPSSEEEKVSYIALYSYLSSKKRYGVVGKCPGSVKDFYIVPLASHQAIPQVLLPFDGPGFEDNRPHMLIAVIIKSKPKSFILPIKDIIKPKEDIVTADDLEEYSPPDEISDSPIMVDDPDLSHPSKEQEDLLMELNRQIENDRAEITQMQSSFDQKIEDTKSTQPEISQVVLPANLQDILDNINKKEIAIKEKENEIQKRLQPEPVIDASKDVDLRVLMPASQPPREMLMNPPPQPPNFNYYPQAPQMPQVEPSFPVQPKPKSQLHSMSDNDLLQKAREMEADQFPPEPYLPVEQPPVFNNQVPFEQPPPHDYGYQPHRGGHQGPSFRPPHPRPYDGPPQNHPEPYFQRERHEQRVRPPFNHNRRDHQDRNWGNRGSNRGGFRPRPRFDGHRPRHHDNRDRRRFN